MFEEKRRGVMLHNIFNNILPFKVSKNVRDSKGFQSLILSEQAEHMSCPADQ